MTLPGIATTALLVAMMAAPAFARDGNPDGFNWNRDNIRGWSLMTEQERTQHQARMYAAKSYEECKALQEEQDKAMEARAKEKGVPLPVPQHDGCDVMRSRGVIK
ncbi:hypothetical protein [Herbaspirillum sp. RV1423]|uniref:hypothetical protein n=1 Tax=Herbaspirillum sp. RV1423 TaxID=1443993 RepID=UPI0005517AA5|nr:hypothetical protein [Herbaspirillum sp. RV1423]